MNDSRKSKPASRRYESPGFCIYCFKTPPEVKLTDEHIWPESLYGYDLLLGASCQSCAAILSKVDGYLARHVYYDLRLRCGFRSKRKNKKKHPTQAETKFLRNGIPESVITPVEDKAFSVALPKFQPPGILRGNRAESHFGHMAIEGHNFIEELFKHVKVEPNDIIEVPVFNIIDPIKFAKGIAKIAYCTAVSFWGVNRYSGCIIPSILLGECDYLPYVVGSPNEPTPAYVDSDALHHQWVYATQRDGIIYLVVRLRPFATYGSHNGGNPIGFPIYDVVIGEISEQQAREGPRPRQIA